MLKMTDISITIFESLELKGIACGDVAKPKLLALHGWLDNANSFLPMMPYINNYYVVAIDVPGHGYSDHLSPDAIYHFIDTIIYGFAIADELKWQTFSLLGHSMGAGIATLMAGTLSKRIEELFLIEGLGPLVHEEGDAPKHLEKFLNVSKRYLSRKPRFYPDLEAAAKTRAQNSDLTLAMAEILVARALQKEQSGFMWRHDPRLLLPSITRFTEEQVLAFIKNITCPTKLIIADKGFSYGHKMMQQRIATANDLTVINVEGGHHVHMEKPKEIADSLGL